MLRATDFLTALEAAILQALEVAILLAPAAAILLLLGAVTSVLGGASPQVSGGGYQGSSQPPSQQSSHSGKMLLGAADGVPWR